MHQDLLQLQACQNPLDDQKHKSLRSWYSEITLIDALEHVDQKLPISWECFWAIIFSLDRNDKNNFGPNHPFKTILTWKEMLQSERSSMICVVTRSRQIEKHRKKTKQEKKIDCHVTHLKNSIEFKRKSRKAKNVDKMKKKCINTNRFSLARNCFSV